MTRVIEAGKIVLMCIAAAVAYGITHDLITAHVCVEYFSIGHPQVFAFKTSEPIPLAVAWGIIATWWVGLMLGILLSFAALAGSWPKRTMRSLVKPVIQLMLACGLLAVFAGVLGYCLAEEKKIRLLSPLGEAIPSERHSRFLADWFAHNASYAGGFVGGVIVMINVVRSRIRDSASQNPHP